MLQRHPKTIFSDDHVQPGSDKTSASNSDANTSNDRIISSKALSSSLQRILCIDKSIIFICRRGQVTNRSNILGRERTKITSRPSSASGVSKIKRKWIFLLQHYFFPRPFIKSATRNLGSSYATTRHSACLMRGQFILFNDSCSPLVFFRPTHNSTEIHEHKQQKENHGLKTNRNNNWISENHYCKRIRLQLAASFLYESDPLLTRLNLLYSYALLKEFCEHGKLLT